MDLHVGYESVAPAKLKCIDLPDEKARKAKLSPKCILKADKDGGRIIVDSETTLTGITSEAWDYRLGNRSALEWILDQYKEKKPKDPTIREKFNTYRFADYKKKMIDLLSFDLFFSQADEGTVSLGGDEAQKYRDCLSGLWEAVSSSEQLSLRANLDRLFG